MNEQDPDLLADDNLDQLRDRNRYPAMSERYRLTEELENARYQNNLMTEKCRELQERIDAMKHEVEAKEKINNTLTSSFDALRKERDEARRTACKGEAMLRLQRNRVHRDSEEVVRMTKEISVERGWEYLKDNP